MLVSENDGERPIWRFKEETWAIDSVVGCIQAENTPKRGITTTLLAQSAGESSKKGIRRGIAASHGE